MARWSDGERPGTISPPDTRGPFPREELEREFVRYQERGAAGDWSVWADQFTEDAVYVEHEYGVFRSREEIRSWITATMSAWPGNEMPAFPVAWSVIDADAGVIVAKIWNRMQDPGDGSRHEEYNLSVLHYAGDGAWSYEEDVYNPTHFATMIGGYVAARRDARARERPPPA